jgi:hypothetical protein
MVSMAVGEVGVEFGRKVVAHCDEGPSVAYSQLVYVIVLDS